jgi:hypothetical protein
MWGLSSAASIDALCARRFRRLRRSTELLGELAEVGVRMLDNVLDATPWLLPQQR